MYAIRHDARVGDGNVVQDTDHCLAGALHRVDRGMILANRKDDHPIHVSVQIRLDHRRLTIGPIVAEREIHDVAALPADLLDLRTEHGEKLVLHVRQENPDRLGEAGGKRSGVVVGLKPVFLYDLENTLTSPRVDPRFVVNRPVHGSFRDAADAGYAIKREALSRSHPVVPVRPA